MATVDQARRAAGQLRAEAAQRRAHEAAQAGRNTPVLDTSAVYRTQFRLQQASLPIEPGPARVQRFGGQVVRGETTRLNGKELEHVSGYATVFDRGYPMWDEFGGYEETVTAGAADHTLAASPDVMFLMNHTGALMARTKPGAGMAPTLVLRADLTGMFDDVYVNARRPDVQILLSAVEDGLMTEQSFAFLVDAGWWSDDFTAFYISAFDLDRGDVSGVNMGANPFTSIGARSQELMATIDAMPHGLARAAFGRLADRADVGAPGRQLRVVASTQERTLTGERSGSKHVQRLAQRVASTTARAIEQANAAGGGIDLANIRLPWFEIVNAAGDDRAEPDTATVFVYESIGGSFGITADEFAAELQAITASNIKLRINSPGGSVFDSIAIYNSLNQHPARITTYVDSLAASGASVVAMAGDQIIMMPGSQMMVHQASMVEDGNPDDMRKAAEFLDRQSENIAGIYAQRAGGTAAHWRELMNAETWAFASEAVDMGLADEIDTTLAPGPNDPIEAGDDSDGDQGDAAESGALTVADRMRRSHDLSHFRYAGRRNAPSPGERRVAAASIGGRPAEQRAAVQVGRSIAQVMAMIDMDD